ncbi:DUF4349 domain-containing protein [Chloroflexota bacterium]
MKKLTLGIVALLILCLAFLSCAGAPSQEIDTPPAPPSMPSAVTVPRPVPAPTEPALDKGTPETAYSQSWAGDRMIVRIGNIHLVVNDVPITQDRIARLAADLDGYVVSSQRWKEGERLVGIISIRVPAGRFDDAMRTLRELAVEVTSEDSSSKDVTEEYVDLSAKLKNLEATEEQLLRLMEKAETVEEILNVQKELSRTRGDIEQTKARMQYLERTSTTSLIEVRLEQAEIELKFTADKARVKRGEDIQFANQIAGGFSPYSYQWDFGDGSTSTTGSPVHAYSKSGSYTVSLTVTDDRGNTDSEIRSEYIVVLPGWNAGSVAGGAVNGLFTFGRVLANILIWLAIFSPVWLIIGGIVYWRRRRKKKRSQ